MRGGGSRPRGPADGRGQPGGGGARHLTPSTIGPAWEARESRRRPGVNGCRRSGRSRQPFSGGVPGTHWSVWIPALRRHDTPEARPSAPPNALHQQPTPRTDLTSVTSPPPLKRRGVPEPECPLPGGPDTPPLRARVPPRPGLGAPGPRVLRGAPTADPRCFWRPTGDFHQVRQFGRFNFFDC